MIKEEEYYASLLSSSSLTPFFSDDITLQIIIRLPSKSVIRLSCLSKLWYVFIFSNQHNFARSHLQHHHPHGRGGAFWMGYFQRFFSYRDGRRAQDVPRYLADADPVTMFRTRRYGSLNICFHLPDGLVMVACCDGVLCFFKRNVSTFLYNKKDVEIYLWNPVLRQCIQLPSRINVGYYCNIIGFGFDSFSQDYIVAKIQYCGVIPEGRTIHTVDVYTLKTHSWTTIRFEPISLKFSPDQYNSKCVVLNGYVYWLNPIKRTTVDYIHATKGDNDDGKEQNNHHHPMLLIPDFVMIVPKHRRLALYKGRLALYGNTGDGNYELWVMPEAITTETNNNNDDGSWMRKFVISTRDLGFQFRDWWDCVTPSGRILGFDQNQAANLYARIVYGLMALCERLVLYNPETRNVEEVKDGMTQWGVYYAADNYVESFVPLMPLQHILLSTQNKMKKKKKISSLWRKIFLPSA
ncbi:OLC1v1029726C1 [Oldenlandia corymbosa var. corymbosa]|uniref:OLC1v1029726C1 n=1 Tax=Oldenlandia corymbosa var. corymbosa TaxID=529605 RepID=A0AAV1CF62_OLDCO|nr:OLC1v1029726C1 [Oldenlandia corymbosa var. corymbosa]